MNENLGIEQIKKTLKDFVINMKEAKPISKNIKN